MTVPYRRKMERRIALAESGRRSPVNASGALHRRINARALARQNKCWWRDCSATEVPYAVVPRPDDNRFLPYHLRGVHSCGVHLREGDRTVPCMCAPEQARKVLR